MTGSRDSATCQCIPRSNSCRALCPNPTAPTLRNPTSHSRHTFHPLPTRFPSLSLLVFHHSLDSLSIPLSSPHRDLSNSIHVSFHGVRVKTFSTHVITKIAPAVRETGLFTHGRASPNFTNIPMCTPGVAVPCLCYAWLGCAMPLRHRTIGSSRARTLVVPCVLTPQLTPFAIPHLTPDTLSILSLLVFHPSSSALSVHLSFPHRPSPILAMIPSMACVLKRFPLASPRKFALPCVKRGFLRTAEPHRTSQLSPCSPMMSQCHVYVMPGRDVACPTPSPRCPAPAPGFHFLKFLTIISISPTVSS